MIVIHHQGTQVWPRTDAGDRGGYWYLYLACDADLRARAVEYVELAARYTIKTRKETPHHDHNTHQPHGQ